MVPQAATKKPPSLITNLTSPHRLILILTIGFNHFHDSLLVVCGSQVVEKDSMLIGKRGGIITAAGNSLPGLLFERNV